MAKRRMISQELIIDEEFNSLSIEAQNLFLRMLVVSDDYGVVPANEYALSKLINPPKKIARLTQHYLDEISSVGLGGIVGHNGRQFFIFKPEAFERHQSYILGKRRKSEYLRISKGELDSGKFKEILGNVRRGKDVSRKKRDVSKEQKEVSRKDKPKDLAEVKERFISKKYFNPSLEAEKFWNFYESKGWKVGGDPMKNWKASAAGWNSRNKEKYQKPEPAHQSVRTGETGMSSLADKLNSIQIKCAICGKVHKPTEKCE